MRIPQENWLKGGRLKKPCKYDAILMQMSGTMQVTETAEEGLGRQELRDKIEKGEWHSLWD